MAPLGALLQKSLLHGFFTVFLGRERRFFLRCSYAIHMYRTGSGWSAYLCRSFVVRFSMDLRRLCHEGAVFFSAVLSGALIPALNGVQASRQRAERCHQLVNVLCRRGESRRDANARPACRALSRHCKNTVLIEQALDHEFLVPVTTEPE